MEKLYNNIVWDEKCLNEESDAKNVPYLKNPPDIIDVSVGRQLFVDDFLIESTELKPEYHTAKKYEANPILKPETTWEFAHAPVACPKSGGVWYDEEEKIFKMKQVFVLSAFPEFLVDYFGLKLWKTCVKHTTNKLYNQKCQNNFRNNYSGNFIFKQLKNG